MEKIKLSFCIPTWNRANELKECLDSIIEQVVEGNYPVEIFISDNASTDGTAEVLDKYAKKYKFIRYSRNEKNLGYDLNLITAIEKSEGEYAWLFGDDDILERGALEKVQNIIEIYKPVYISTNYYYWRKPKEDFEEREVVKIKNHQSFMERVKTDIPSIDFEKLLNLRNHWFGFLSSNIIKKNSVNLESVKNNIEKIRSWSQIDIVAQSLSKGKGFVTSYYCVGSRFGNGRENPCTFSKLMPEAFKYVFRKHKVRENTERRIFYGIRKTFLSPKSILVSKVKGESLDISPEIRPEFYMFLFKVIPKSLIKNGWKIKRFLSGKGFSIPMDKI